jgi:hypothetical protein
VCTLTWLQFEHGYELFFNRDEKRTRARALPPRVTESPAGRWIAPTDPDGGGTWIGVNSRGVTLALLNGYEPGDRAARDFDSRGGLVTSLLDAASAAEVIERIEATDLARFRSFSLVVFQPDVQPISATWDGEHCDVRVLDDGEQPICSSSLDPLGARASRRKVFDAHRRRTRTLDRAALVRFHASHEPERGSLSPCMHRDDAHTVSFTRISVTSALVELAYTPSAPCERASATSLSLERETSLASSGLDGEPA